MVSSTVLVAILSAVAPFAAARASKPWDNSINNDPSHWNKNHGDHPWRWNCTGKPGHYGNSSHPPPKLPPGEVIPDKYIITLRPNATSVEQHLRWVRSIHARNVQRRQTSLDMMYGVKKIFEVGGFRAYSGAFDPNTIADIRSHPDVLLVEPDVKMHLAHAVDVSSMEKRGLVGQRNPPWHLTAISRKPPPGSTDYVFDGNALGKGTFAYVLDSGINEEHKDFEGRAKTWYNAIDSSGPPITDNSGHGTFVAGLIGGHTYGVAKQVALIGVKVFERGEEGSDSSTVIDGFQWALNDILNNNRQNVSVINLAFNGPRLDTWDILIQNAYDSGVLVVVAAGNDNTNVDALSPASAPNALTVAAIGQDYARAEFSNFGTGVNIFAPGKDLTGPYIGGPDATRAGIRGTSFSAGIVSGLVCYLRSLHGSNVPGNVITNMLEQAISDAVKDTKGSPNKLAYNGSGA